MFSLMNHLNGNEETSNIPSDDIQYAIDRGAEEADLLIFNRNPNLSWTEKIFSMEKEFSGKKIFVCGMQDASLHRPQGRTAMCPCFFCTKPQKP